MTRSRLLVGLASVLAGTTALLAVFGLVYNPILLVAAVPFGVATYFIWSHATGRLDARMRERSRRWPVDGDGSGPGRHPTGATSGDPNWRGSGATPADASRSGNRRDAARVLGVEPGADEATVRRAYREKAKDLHPDAPGGDEAAFRRVRDAYERLRTDR